MADRSRQLREPPRFVDLIGESLVTGKNQWCPDTASKGILWETSIMLPRALKTQSPCVRHFLRTRLLAHRSARTMPDRLLVFYCKLIGIKVELGFLVGAFRFRCRTYATCCAEQVHYFPPKLRMGNACPNLPDRSATTPSKVSCIRKTLNVWAAAAAVPNRPAGEIGTEKPIDVSGLRLEMALGLLVQSLGSGTATFKVQWRRRLAGI